MQSTKALFLKEKLFHRARPAAESFKENTIVNSFSSGYSHKKPIQKAQALLNVADPCYRAFVFHDEWIYRRRKEPDKYTSTAFRTAKLPVQHREMQYIMKPESHPFRFGFLPFHTSFFSSNRSLEQVLMMNTELTAKMAKQRVTRFDFLHAGSCVWISFAYGQRPDWNSIRGTLTLWVSP